MRIHTKRILQVALVSGGLLLVGAGSAGAAGVSLQQPVPALDAVPSIDVPAVLYPVAAPLWQHVPAPSAEASGELQEPDLNAPLGSELAATELPALPLTATSHTTPDTTPERAIGDGLPLLGGLLPSLQGALPVLPGVPDLTQSGPGALLGSATGLLGH